MGSKRCRLYDENLVHNIMLSTGLSVIEYMRENTKVDSDEICDFIESNAETIISDTIRHLKSMDDPKTKDNKGKENDTDEWPLSEDSEEQ